MIQNLKAEQKQFYLFSHPVFNKLIDFDFTPNELEEVVANFISFLKMISLTLTERPELLQFFFNDRFKHFPLYSAAIKLYNYNDGMVRIAVRTITLSVYNLMPPDLCEIVLSLPHCTYFPHLAC